MTPDGLPIWEPCYACHEPTAVAFIGAGEKRYCANCWRKHKSLDFTGVPVEHTVRIIQ